MDGGLRVGQRVRLLSPVDTFRAVMPAGLELWVHSPGGPGRWNLRDAAGVVRVSALESERFAVVDVQVVELVEGGSEVPAWESDTDRKVRKPAAKRSSSERKRRKRASERNPAQGSLFG